MRGKARSWKEPEWGEVRIIETFLWWPLELPIGFEHGPRQSRWFERVKILMKFDKTVIGSFRWFNKFWVDDVHEINKYIIDKDGHKFLSGNWNRGEKLSLEYLEMVKNHRAERGKKNANWKKKQADCHQNNKQQKTTQAMVKNFEGGNK